MKVSPKDTPKVIGLLLAIGICFVLIGKTFLGRSKSPAEEKAPAVASNIVAGSSQTTADLEPQAASPQQYAMQIEAWSRPPTAPQGDPFREVLPRDVVRQIRAQAPPPREISGALDGGVDPTKPLPGVAANIDFPTISVRGVVVDTSGPKPTSFATLNVNDQVFYAKAGDVIGNDLVVEQVSELGVKIRAAKEHCFIEVSKSYKPTGMAPPAPPKPAAQTHRRARRSR